MKTFTEKVHDVVKKIPRGKVLTYTQVAAKAGNPKAVRAVGTIMSKNFNPDIPCHRVIRTDGKIGEYNRGGPKAKEEILRLEGFRPILKS
ncbi:MAG: MGMT family protein [Candidatus Zambryskibacteria bacterium]|nr:MGMT family protein [Candidatus Zambryskibacteria bacterium]